MNINSIELVELNYNIRDLKPDDGGTVYIALKASISNHVKNFDDNKYYVETKFKLLMSQSKLDDATIEKNKIKHGLFMTYGVYVDSKEVVNNFTDEEQELILMYVEPFFSQKVSNLFSESNMKVPKIPTYFWKEL